MGIAGERIVALAQGTLSPAAETIDATRILLLTDAIDTHFHCRMPAYPEQGDFETETQAASPLIFEWAGSLFGLSPFDKQK